MAVSVKEAFKALFSEKYNKKDVCAYLLVMFILSVIYLGTSLKSLTGLLIGLISCTLLYILYFGYFAKTSHNEIFKDKKEFIFPRLGNFSETFSLGIKYAIFLILQGILFLSIPAFIIAALVITLSVFVFHVSAVLASVITLIPVLITFILATYYFMVPLNLVFYRSLKVKDLFDTKKALLFIKEKPKKYSVFFFQMAGIAILLSLTIVIVLCFLIPILNPALKNLEPDEFKNFTSSLYGILMLIAQSLIYPNLIGQIAKYEKEQ